MRIAVLSDIHGNLPALEAVVNDFWRRGVGLIVNLGDCLSGPLLPRQTAEFLMAQSWRQIAGNQERQILTGNPGEWSASDAFAHSELGTKELAWMASLEPTATGGEDILLCHGTPTSDAAYLLETVEHVHARTGTLTEVDGRLGKRTQRHAAALAEANGRLGEHTQRHAAALADVDGRLGEHTQHHAAALADVDGRLGERTHVRVATLAEIDHRLGDVSASLILCGHSHVPRSIRSSKGQLIVNPGSVGLPAYEATDPVAHVIETGSPDARYALVEKAERGWVASLVSVPYDHMSMAKLARERGRDDWARALASGYVT